MNGPSHWRSLIDTGKIIAVPGAYDVLSATIIAAAGHQGIYLGGNAIALAFGKGQPFVTLSETTEVTARVCRAVDLPVIVDAGAGFGGPSHIDRAVRDLEFAGAAAVHIDDQPYPKSPDYHRGKGMLADPRTMAVRIATACAARKAGGLSIIARTDALRVTGSIAQTVMRARVCHESGAEGLIVLDLEPRQASVIRDAVPDLPLYWIGGVHPPIPTLDMLAATGFSAALYPFNGIAEVSTRLGDLWGSLAKTGNISQDSERLARARDETLAFVDMARAWAVEDRAADV